MVTTAAVAAESTSGAMDYEAGFYYTVKKGDTLWDLSQRFSDSPWQWPDLWRENKQIPNPHWIYPGERIRIYRKSGQYASDKTTQAVQPASDLKEVPAVTPQVEASTPAQQPKLEVDFFFPDIDRVGFIREPAVQPLGVIFKCLRDKELISKGDTIYIRYGDGDNKSAFQPGARMTIYRAIDPHAKNISNESTGNQHYLVGVAEIVSSEPDYAIAKVIESYRAIFLEDKVMPYEPRSPNIPVVDSVPGIKGQIIVAEEHQLLMGDHMFAFMDKGADDHILPGQIYNIYLQETAKIEGVGKTELKPVEIGALIVLHVEKDNSTVFITKSNDKITSGHLVLTP
jgi:hypothetical protein